jgi:hypothetical protein
MNKVTKYELIDRLDFSNHAFLNITYYVSGTESVSTFRFSSSPKYVTT